MTQQIISLTADSVYWIFTCQRPSIKYGHAKASFVHEVHRNLGGVIRQVSLARNLPKTRCVCALGNRGETACGTRI
jgi:hypothetical protein